MTPTAEAILARLRDGLEPDADELVWFSAGLASGAVSDAQAGAFAMAVCMRPPSDLFTERLTRAMRASGDTLEWGAGAPVLDKHSTGGVGDCTSLVLAPALAACGARVPMLSGRGLGHTGGTLDKLEAVPGVSTALDAAQLRAVLNAAGCVIAGPTALIAPADRRLYAVRDVTGTVPSVALITASILSKKLAAQPGALVLDVKVGTGAFMKDMDAARRLARALVRTAQAAGCPARAVLTDMDAPVASSIGHTLEIRAALEVLTGDVRGRLWDLTIALGAEALVLGGLAADGGAGAAAMEAALTSGAAAERFGRMIVAMGGPADLLSRPDRLPSAPVKVQVPAPADGWVARIDGEALGHGLITLGGGRLVETDRIDPAVGLEGVAGVGSRTQAGAPLAVIHAATQESADRVRAKVASAFTVTPHRPAARPLILDRVST